LFAIHAATGAEMMSKLIEVVAGELRRAAAAAPTEAEVARAKAQIKAGMLMGLESSSARAEYMARQLLLFDKLIDTKEVIARIEAVTPEDIRMLAARLLTSKPSITIVGAGREGTKYATMAERMVLEEAAARPH
jgi:predicted Zn-dependent peptidase